MWKITAFRVSTIPRTLARNELVQALPFPHTNNDDGLFMSEIYDQRAIMTFNGESEIPPILANCTISDSIEIPIRVDGKRKYVYADNSFMGMTTLFSSGADAEVE